MTTTQSSASPLPTTVSTSHNSKTTQPSFSGYVPHSRGYRRILVSLFLSGTGIFAQLYAPQAVLPDLRTNLEITAGQAGLVVSMGTIGLALGVIPWAAVSDRLGRVLTMRAAIIAGSILTLVSCFSPNYETLLALRFVSGFAIGAVPALALSYLNSEVHPNFTAKAAGVFIAGNSIGGLLGRIVAGLGSAQWGWQGGMLAVSVIASLAALGFVCTVPKAHGKPPLAAGNSAQKTHPYKQNFQSTTQRKIFLAGFLLMGAFVSVYNYMGFRLQGAPYYVPPALTAFLFVGLLAGTVASLFAASIVAKWGRSSVLAGAGLVLACGIGATLVPTLWAQAVGLLLVTVGFFGGQSVASGWASAHLPVARTQAGALYTLSYYAGGSFMGWLGGEVLEFYGWTAFVGVIAVLGLCISAVAVSLRRSV